MKKKGSWMTQSDFCFKRKAPAAVWTIECSVSRREAGRPARGLLLLPRRQMMVAGLGQVVVAGQWRW